MLTAKEGGLGTFGGVFTPSILTILGVIMYLRFGWVVANVGLIGTLIIVTLSTSITFLTGLSIASIATDQRVRIGGAYYMISRSLGIESGGAIGIPLYFAQALSVALYTVGFAESLVRVFPGLGEKVIGIVTTILVSMLALASAKAAIRAQYVIMFGIVLSLLSLAFGTPLEGVTIDVWNARTSEPESFWVVFAVFFPAVTGIMAGVNMSGDLKTPKKSIPTGTFAAIGVGYLIYMALPFILAMRADTDSLLNDPLVMRNISFWGDAILVGVWGATLSSAVGSILGAPRVLQALAKDQILPPFLRWLGKGSGEEDTPRLGTIFTMAIALLAVWFGDLNLIAPVLTMFFLTTYGVLNVAAGTERFLGSPSFRPTFRVHWLLSLLGAVGCIAVMFLINGVATVIAFVFVGVIFAWLKRREMRSAWGDISRGIWMAVIRAGLMQIREEEHDPKNWRPNPLVLAGSPTKRWHLIDFANTITHNRGLLSVASLIPEGAVSMEQKQSMTHNIREFLLKRGIQGLVKVIAADDRSQGVINLVQSFGLGALEPNTIILGDSEDSKFRPEFCRMITKFHEFQRNVLIVHKGEGERAFRNRKRIDVWWGGLKGNGGLMMILAYLMNSSLDWRDAEVHIKMMVQDEDAVEPTRENILALLEEIRIRAIVDIIPAKGRNFDQVLKKHSSNADLVFLGLAEPHDGFESYYEKVQKRIEGLPTTVLALAAQEISYGEVLIKKDTME